MLTDQTAPAEIDLAARGSDAASRSRSRASGAVAICARGKEELERAAAELSELGPEEDRRALVEETLDRFGRIDILVNNAGTISEGGTSTIRRS